MSIPTNLLFALLLGGASAPPAGAAADAPLTGTDGSAPLAAADVSAMHAPDPCAASDAPGVAPARDLYCVDLVPTPAAAGASGTAAMNWVPTPFGVAVTRDGAHLFDFTVSVRGLPDPATLGEYTTYVAWITSPLLRPMIKLGAVGDGRAATGRAALNQFLVLVTAERSANVTEREGRIVLRGLSPSRRMQPHDLPFVLAATLGAAGPGDPGHAGDPGDAGGAAHAGHARDRAGAEPPLRWSTPPMHPAIVMPPQLMALRPDVAPYLPRPAAGAAVPAARPSRPVRLADGDTLRLEAGLVRRTINGRTFVMYGFNGQYPGPLIEVDRGVTIVVDFYNGTDHPSAVHWHGVRLDNRFDGVPHVTQAPVEPGGRFTYHVRFPDAGIYWYHPHHREDITQDLGLYGNMLVRSARPDAFGPAHSEQVLMLDDLLIGDEGLVPYGAESATHALMGRFGNVLLVNGETRYDLDVRRGEVVRFFLTNVSNTRTFNVSFGGARMKVVGSDVGRFEREQWVESVVIAPAERYIVDVRFEEPGAAAFTNRVQAIDHIYGAFFPEVDTLGVVRVDATPAAPDHAAAFARLREHADVRAEIEPYREHFDRPVDRELVLTLELGELPFPVGPLVRLDSVFFNPVEWSGTMPAMNWVATGSNTRWILREPATGRENMDITWRFERGEVVKLRLTNNRHAAHAMQHPIHIHGQRFLVLAVNGVRTPNLVWKDTILLPVGATADLLLELSNPGRWMLHCHVAEHLETGMMMVFDVVQR